MTRNLEISNELLAISQAVANLNASMPYHVPDGYFETLSDVILARVHAGSGEESAVVSVAGKSTPFEVPEGYFTSLSDSILSKIKTQQELSAADELKELSPMLSSISRTNVYTVPQGYFDTVANELSEKVTERSNTKVVNLFTQRRWVQMAAAASVILMVAFGVNRLIGNKQQVDGYVKLGLKQYNTEQKINEDLQSINEAELISYLENTSNTSDVANLSGIAEGLELNEETPAENDELLESFMKQLDQPEQTTKTN
jgi:hypothetical protein